MSLDKKALKEKFESEIPGDLKPHYDLLVEDYKFHATIHARAPFYNPKIMLALVQLGWRKTP